VRHFIIAPTLLDPSKIEVSKFKPYCQVVLNNPIILWNMDAKVQGSSVKVPRVIGGLYEEPITVEIAYSVKCLGCAKAAKKRAAGIAVSLA
jgi:hypothetical protein